MRYAARLGVTLVCLSLLTGAAAHAQINPFQQTRRGPRLSAEDNRLLLDSVERLNTAEPVRAGSADSWTNPETRSSGTSTIERVFRAHGQPCHRIVHHIVVSGRTPGTDYRLTWCRTPSGAWKAK